MAVEARHLNHFPPQLINRNPMSNDIQGNAFPSHHTELIRNNKSNTPFAAATRFLPEQNNQFSYNPADVVYCSAADSSLQATDQSGLSFINPRKRSREEAVSVGNEEAAAYYYTNSAVAGDLPPPQYNPSAVLGELDLLPQIQRQHQLDIDALISQYTKKIRLELEEREKQRALLLISSIGEGIAMRRLREKEEQISKIGKINQALQEKVKSLYLENQLWRELAQSNEATANSLRSNLEQVLSSMNGADGARAEDEDDAESCCGSSDDVDDVCRGDGVVSRRPCKVCGEGEACVMVLPCRHLCLCGGCGGGSRAVTACPVCSSGMNATLHVNLASS